MTSDLRRNRLLLLTTLFVVACLSAFSGDIPDWLLRQLPDRSVLTTPGAYPLADDKILGVGEGKISEGLRDERALRLATERAALDAKRRIALFLFPDEFKKYRRIDVVIAYAQTVLTSHAGQPDVTVCLVADANGVALRPSLGLDVIIDAHDIQVAPEVLPYLAEYPVLQDGGARIFSHDDGWFALAVGLAALPTGADARARHEGSKIARAAAGRELSELIFGNHIEVLEVEAESVIEAEGIARAKEWLRKETRETVQGMLHQAEQVGAWLTDDGHIAVVLAVGTAPPGLRDAVPMYEDGDSPEHPDINIAADWEGAFRSHPGILKGGAALYNRDDGTYALAIGVSALSGNPALDMIRAPRAAEIDARRQIVRYLEGFSLLSKIEAIEEMELTAANNGGLDEVNQVESLQKRTRERSVGKSDPMLKVGDWRSKDGKVLYAAFVMSLE